MARYLYVADVDGQRICQWSSAPLRWILYQGTVHLARLIKTIG